MAPYMSGIELIAASFPDLDSRQLGLLERYTALLLEANTRVNLISRKDVEHVWTRHLLHALSIARVVSFAPGQQVVDVGTGGGLPGIPLAIAFPETRFLLVDSVGKKIKAVQWMISELGIANAMAKNMRIEESTRKFDFAVSRAVTRLPVMAEWLKGLIQRGHKATLPNGLIYIKGGDFSGELEEIGKPWKVWELSQWFDDPFFETKKVVWIDIAT